ncbi:MAG: LysR family transcriptional regulator [Acetobacteraceae bacterium]
MLDVPALTAFIAIADAGTVHAAAARLGVSQPALSRRLQRLETALGVRLFARSGQRLRLSEVGAQLLPQARAHLDGLGRVLADVRDAARYGTATVTVGCLATLSVEILPGILADYARSRPQVRLRVLDLSAREIEQSVREGTADFALTMLGVPEPGLTQELLAEEPMVLLAAAGHELAARPAARWRDLAGVKLIAIGPQSANRRLLESVQASIGVELEWQHEVQRLGTAVELVAAGMGLAVLPLLAATASPRTDVRAIPLLDPPVTRRLGVIRRSGEFLSPAADALRRAFAARLRQRLPKLARLGAALEGERSG